jgi:glycosyltransferase involved in cell wall biosynthesis
VQAARELDREPHLLHPRFVRLVDSAAQLAQARRIARAVRGARSAWVVAAAGPYGYGAVRSGRPYSAWIGTTLESEWQSRRASLPASRRAALALNAPVLRRLERRVLGGAQTLFATSASSRDAVAAVAEVEPETVGILPIPIDLDEFAPEPDELWRDRLDRPTVVFVGRGDDPRKNVELLLEAWPSVHEAVPDAHLRLVGRSPLVRLPVAVESAGEVTSVAAELRRASLFVLPSLQEGFGIVAAEALASGVPVVTTPSGGPEELVRASGGGVVIDDFEPETLAAAVIRALADGRRLAEQRTSGRRYVEANHSPERFREQLAGAFMKVDRA